VPGSHAAQVRSAVGEPELVTRSPGVQVLHAVQDDCPGVGANEPEGQVASTPPVQNEPAGQVVHEVAFVVVEYEPGAQVAQVRSLVGEPALTTT
jgi:hypothetical protein